MKAVVWDGPSEGVSLKVVPVPKAAPGEIVIEVKASGLCRSDLAIIKGQLPVTKWPLVLGHQTAGIVSGVGDNVGAFRLGDRVVATPDITCSHCNYCLIGRSNLCRNLTRLGFERDGSHAEFVVTAENSVIRLPDNVSFEQGAVSVDAVASMYHALIGLAQVKPGDKVVLLGIGGMGIQAIDIAHIAGASVLVTSRNSKRLDFAKQLGADILVNTTTDDLTKEVMNFTSGEGADVVVNSIGARDTMKQALEFIRPGGKILAIGMIDPEFVMPQYQMVMREVEIIASRLATKLDMIKVLNLIAGGKLHPAVTASYPLTEFQKGFEALERGEIMGRGVLIP
ncbi:alcohol dehydrogenase catalytic domain-containing protein [Chloroflexota bacterium]